MSVGLAVGADVVVPGGVGTLVNVGAALHTGHVTHFTLVTSAVLCSARSVPQPVVQSRRRPLLGPSPG